MAILDGLEPWLIAPANHFLHATADAGLRPRVTSGRRTSQQQAILYERFLRGESQFPAAPPGRSKHEQGRAFDMVCDDLHAAGAYWQLMGGRWFASDPIHFEA